MDVNGDDDDEDDAIGTLAAPSSTTRPLSSFVSVRARLEVATEVEVKARMAVSDVDLGFIS